MAIIMEDDHTSMNELTDEEPTEVDQTPLSIPVQNKCNVTTPELVIMHTSEAWKRNVRKKKMKLKVRNTAPAEGR